MKLCTFCNINEATQTDSHIFTDFITTSLKREGNISRVHKITKDFPHKVIKPTQDTPKESNLFCPTCENGFSNKYERKISFTFYKNFLEKTNQFNVRFRKYNLSYNVYTNTDYILFKKFIFLQLYRIGVSNLAIKNNIALPSDQLNLLHKNLYDIEFFQDIKTLIFTTDFKWSKTSNLIFAGAVTNTSYILWINEFIIIIQFDHTEILFRELEHAMNYENNSPRIIMASKKLWEHFTNTVANTILTQK